MESSVDNINVFENGGVIDLSSTNNQMSDLGKAMMTQYSNYDENLEKYQERLAPFAYQPRSWLTLYTKHRRSFSIYWFGRWL